MNEVTVALYSAKTDTYASFTVEGGVATASGTTYPLVDRIPDFSRVLYTYDDALKQFRTPDGELWDTVEVSAGPSE